MSETMSAIIKTAPKPGCMEYVTDFPKPEIKEDEILVQVKACGICGTDHSLYGWNEAIAKNYNIQFPAVFGHEFSGVVAEIGPAAPKNFKIGDRVVVNPVLFCNVCSYCAKGQINICDNRPFYGTDLPGAFAEYVAIRGTNLIPLPDNVSYEEGALLEALGVAINAVDRVSPQMGDCAVVLGCGAIGLLMLKVLKYIGIEKVMITGLGVDKKRLALAEKMGAIPINCDECDPVERVKELTGGRGVQVAFDAAGNARAVEQGVQMLAKNGKIGISGLPKEKSTLDMTTISMRQLSIIGNRAYERKTWFQGLDMMANGLDIKEIGSHTLPFSEFEKAMKMLYNREGLRIILVP